MPYARCPTCGRTTFIVRSHAWAWECPRCGDAFVERGEGDDRPADAATHRIAMALALARSTLRMDVALVTAIRDGREVTRHAAGEWPGIDSLVGASVPLEETFCKQMLDGRIGHLVGDVAADARVNHLAMARALGVAAWIGVPLPGPLAELYVLCCLSREARPALGEGDVRLLRGLATALAAYV